MYIFPENIISFEVALTRTRSVAILLLNYKVIYSSLDKEVAKINYIQLIESNLYPFETEISRTRKTTLNTVDKKTSI